MLTAASTDSTLTTHIYEVDVKPQSHPVMWVAGDDKSIVHEQKVIAEGAV